MDHSVDASAGDTPEVKEQRMRSAESSGYHRLITWWKAIVQRRARTETGEEHQRDPPPASVYISAADVMKTPRESAPVSDAKFYWRM